jgi:hypothetical protein
MVGEHPNQTTCPSDDLKRAWRAACVAYRKARRLGELDPPGWLAARAAVLDVRPDFDNGVAVHPASAGAGTRRGHSELMRT